MRDHLFAIVTAVLAFPLPVLSLWPLPAQLESGSSALKLAHNFNIQLDIPNAPADLKDAVTRTKSYIEKDKLERLVLGRGAGDAQKIRAAKSLPYLTVTLSGGKVRSISDEAVDDIQKRVEAYTLTVPADGSPATLKANSSLGVFRGLTTFGQMWYEFEGYAYTAEAPFRIDDAPKYVSCLVLICDVGLT